MRHAYLIVIIGMAAMVLWPNPALGQGFSITKAVTVQIKKAGDEGTVTVVGYGRFEGSKLLVLHLYAPTGYTIKASDCDDRSEGGATMWLPYPNENSNTIPASRHTWTAGVFPNFDATEKKSHAATFTGALVAKKAGGGKAKVLEFEVRVGDLDLDADTDNNSSADHRPPSETLDEDDKEYPASESASDFVVGLLLPLNDNNNVSWDNRDNKKYITNYADDKEVLNAILRINARKPGTLSILNMVPASCWVYDDADHARIDLEFDNAVPKGDDFSKPLRIEADTEMSGVSGTIQSWFSVGGPFTGEKPEDYVKFTLIGVDIDVDSNNDDTIDGTNGWNSGEDFYENHPANEISDLSGYRDYKVGMVVPVNEDDDDANGHPDNGWDTPSGPINWNGPDGTTVQGSGDRDDLRPMILRGMDLDTDQRAAIEADGAQVAIYLRKVEGDGEIRIFTDEDEGDPNEVMNTHTDTGGVCTLPEGAFGLAPEDGHATPTLWQALYGTTDRKFLIEGLYPGKVVLEVAFKKYIPGSEYVTMHRDLVTITVIGVRSIPLFDPKLDGSPAAAIQYAIDGSEAMAELRIMDGTTTVATMLAKTATPVRGDWVDKQWNGTWDHDANAGKFADPKEYTVRLDLYPTASAPTPIATCTAPINVVRLGVQQISFVGDQELVYHKRSHTDANNVPFTAGATFAGDIVWKIKALDFLKADAGARPRTEAKKQKNAVGESFSDTDNSGTRNGSEWYFDADGNSSYTAALRQVNFPGQQPDAGSPADISKSGGPDPNDWNRPVVYVRNSALQLRVKLGEHAISDLSGGNVGVGYPVARYPIRLVAQYDSLFMDGNSQTATANNLNISPTGGPYHLMGSELPDTVGFAEETINYKFQYNATGETFVDANGNGVFDAGEPLTDNDGDNQFDEEWKDIPGTQQTSHLIYRLAAAPETAALNKSQGHERLYTKIVDFTTAWAQTATANTSGEVFDAIWKSSNFWTPFMPVGGVDQPNNAAGFHGIGDPNEADRADEFAHKPKCYTYEHLASTGVSVDNMLDTNAGKCGGWCKFLPAFAAQHGTKLRPVYVLPRAYRSTGAGNPLIGKAAVNALAVGSDFYLCLTQFSAGAIFRTGIYSGDCLFVKTTVDGQAHAASSGTLLSAWSDGHAISFIDNTWNDQVDAGERLFDPSYVHDAGDRRDGFTSGEDYEDSAMLKLVYVKYRVTAQPVIKADDTVDLPKITRVVPTVPITKDCVAGLQETYLYVP